MSASEQEIRSQIAEMREALRSAAAGRRAARVVNGLAVLVGFCIVGFIVWKLISLGISIKDNPEALQAAFQQQLSSLQLGRKGEQIIELSYQTYLNEGRKMITELNVGERVWGEATTMVKDLEPVLRRELNRIQPRVVAMLEVQRDTTLKNLEDLLQKKVADRLGGIIGQQGKALEQETGLTPEKVELMMVTLHDAAAEAFEAVLMRRAEGVQEELNEFLKLLAQLPEAPERTQEEIIPEIINVLVAIVKDELPDYEITMQDLKQGPRPEPSGQPAAAPAGAPVPGAIRAPGAEVPAEAREKMEEARKRGEELREKSMERAGAPEGAAVEPPVRPEIPAEAREMMEEARKKAEELREKTMESTGAPEGTAVPEGAVRPEIPAEAREMMEEARKRGEELRKKAMEGTQ